MNYAGTADHAATTVAGPQRQLAHHVTAVMVVHDGQAWLPRLRSALDSAQRRPDHLLAVDTGSRDNSADLLSSGGWVDQIVTVDRSPGFGAAVAAGIAQAAPPVVDLTNPTGESTIDLRDAPAGPDRAPAHDTVEWLWLLHDDCAPAPDALDRLLAAADRHEDAAVLGPKLRSWRHPDVILQCGVSLSGTGRAETGVVSGEVDQGQHDGRLDVMAVSSAGMLVRRDVWEHLGGFSTTFPLLGDDADFCWRARRAGHRVIVVPDAVVAHRQALSDHLREPDATGQTLRRTNRRAAVVTALIHAPWWRLPFTALRCVLGSLLRVLFHLVMVSPRAAWDDMTGTLAGLVSWRAVAAGRRSERSDDVTAADLRRLRPTIAQRFIGWQESMARHHGSTSAREAARTRRWGRAVRLAAVVGGVVGIVCVLATWGLWFGEGRLAGGALLPAPDSALDLTRFFAAPWHDVGLGSTAAAPPYVLLVAAASVPLLGSAVTATQVLVLLGPVLAGLAAAFALRGLVSRPTLVVAGLAYALLPASIAAVGTGRIGTTLAAILLPGSVRLLTRVTGVASPMPPSTRRTVAGAALVTAALGSAAPALAVTLVALAAVVAVFTRHGRGLVRVAVVAGAGFALLWPWSGSLVTHPALLLADVGAHPAGLGDEATPVWSLALLDPGGPAAPPAGFAGVLVALAALALVPARTRKAVAGAWVLVLAGLLLGIGTALTTVTLPSATTPLHPWPGPATVLAGLGLVLAVGVAATGLLGAGRARYVSRAFLVLALVTPVVLGGWWIAAGKSLLDRQEPGVVSPYVTEASLGSAAPRTLVLSGQADRRVTYQLLSGVGLRLGDADVAPPAASMTEVDRAVGDLAAGGSDTAVPTLREAAVQFVSVDTRGDAALARQLDAVPGLRRLSTLDDEALWEIDDWQPRVRALTPNGPVGIPADPTGPTLTATGPVPADTTAVEISATPSDTWQATLAGTDLSVAPDSPWQAFAVPPGTGGDVSVSTAGPRLAELLVPAVALGLLALAAASRPRRPRRDRPKRVPRVVRRAGSESVGLEVVR